MTELNHITDFINSPAFALMSEEVKVETLSKQKELAEQLVLTKMEEYIYPILDKYNLSISFELKKDQHEMKPHLLMSSPNVPKSPKTGLCVFLPNGDYIQEDKASNTFAEAIRLVGPAKVSDLGLTLDKENIIMNSKNKPLPINPHEIGYGYYVNTHSNTVSKQRMLQKISDVFNLHWKVEIVE